jgi:tRNA-2-methylthio-N6-dimethylallyladenosine synthase
VSAFVTIMQGCDNYCAFCVVPYLRGREESRKFHDILAEVKALAGRGVREVTLLGQNVNSYGKSLGEGHSFAELLRAIGDIPGIERIRFTTSHPKDLTDDIVACFRDVKALCESIHLPVQSGSDGVLARMNRRYTSADYVDRVRRLREACPDIAISSDIIVGFPGETQQDYQKTLDLMEKVRFDTLFSFQYSERQGTAAVGLDGKVSAEEKRRRLIELQALQDRHTQEKNSALVGRTVEVLVEGTSRNTPRDVSGRTRSNKIVNFAGGRDLVGKTVRVRVVEAFLHSLRGEMQD